MGTRPRLHFGRGEKDKASTGAATAIIVSSVLGMLLLIISLAFMEPICRFLGTTKSIMPYALEYGRIIAIELPIMTFGGCVNCIVRADGRPKLSTMSMIVGAFTNIILDPIFIFAFDWGMGSEAYYTHRDLLSALLDKNKLYSKTEVKKLIDGYYPKVMHV